MACLSSSSVWRSDWRARSSPRSPQNSVASSVRDVGRGRVAGDVAEERERLSANRQRYSVIAFEAKLAQRPYVQHSDLILSDQTRFGTPCVRGRRTVGQESGGERRRWVAVSVAASAMAKRTGMAG